MVLGGDHGDESPEDKSGKLHDDGCFRVDWRSWCRSCMKKKCGRCRRWIECGSCGLRIVESGKGRREGERVELIYSRLSRVGAWGRCKCSEILPFVYRIQQNALA